MKVYFIYLLPQNKLYAISNDKENVKRFLSERNSKLFNVITSKIDSEGWSHILTNNKLLLLNKIPVEDTNGNYEIIATISEDNLLSHVCEKMAEACQQLKLHFTRNVKFKKKYINLIDDLTTVNLNLNNHPIVQIDTVKLFYYLFKDTFVNTEELDNLSDVLEDEDIIEKFKSYY